MPEVRIKEGMCKGFISCQDGQHNNRNDDDDDDDDDDGESHLLKLSRCYCGASYPVAQSCGSDLRANRFWDTFPWEPPHQLVVLNLPQLPT